VSRSININNNLDEQEHILNKNRNDFGNVEKEHNENINQNLGEHLNDNNPLLLNNENESINILSLINKIK